MPGLWIIWSSIPSDFSLVVATPPIITFSKAFKGRQLSRHHGTRPTVPTTPEAETGDHLSPGIPTQPEQHRKNLSFFKKIRKQSTRKDREFLFICLPLLPAFPTFCFVLFFMIVLVWKSLWAKKQRCCQLDVRASTVHCGTGRGHGWGIKLLLITSEIFHIKKHTSDFYPQTCCSRISLTLLDGNFILPVCRPNIGVLLNSFLSHFTFNLLINPVGSTFRLGPQSNYFHQLCHYHADLTHHHFWCALFP